ncbi:uncharacterized protein EI90DRAFT_3015540 [Cantharellus anzutake]|uniref:uncharacterized protein n=1 Tax=Cantharellus anzutake TaxID=1750568 RepID=UPI001905801D|nr:uncharacterized protein EI90DRAFT_3015540 [Cantharellus anzutake]KAF8333084.1 hypothetical protein EI90DRAFT_3015540 [Cantharellus anzutake]
MSQAPSIHIYLGIVVVSNIFATSLFGIITVQVFCYFKQFSRDHRILKGLCYWDVMYRLLGYGTLDSSFFVKYRVKLWIACVKVSHFTRSRYPVDRFVRVPFPSDVFFCGQNMLTVAAIASQAYLVHILYKLTENRILPSKIIAIVLEIVSMTFDPIQLTHLWYSALATLLIASTDALICGSLAISIWRRGAARSRGNAHMWFVSYILATGMLNSTASLGASIGVFCSEAQLIIPLSVLNCEFYVFGLMVK